MKWPWGREKRELTYTDAMAAAAYSRADGSPAKVADLAVAGAAARVYALALSLARIEPAGSLAAGLLTPALRAMIGVQLVLSGNSLMALESGDMGLSAVPVTGFGGWRIMGPGNVALHG